MRPVEIAIIGGGSTGLMTAYYLAKEGVKNIHVFEEKYLGFGSTGRCAGGVRASFASDVHIKLMKESINRWLSLKEEISGLEFVQDGYLWLLTTEELVEFHKKLSAYQNSLGVPTRMLNRDEIRDLVPIEMGDVIAALYDPMAGKASPLKFLGSVRRKLRELGVTIHEYTPVAGVRVSSGKAYSVVLDGGSEIRVNRYIVVAAGVWSKDLLEKLGVKIPLRKDPHHLLVTEKYMQFIKPLVIHKETGSYVVQHETGSLLIGAEFPVPEGDMTLRYRYLKKAVTIMSRYFPQILGVNLLRVWIGYYEVTPDHHPIVGEVPHIENLVTATGFSGHGYMMAPVIGEELKNIILEGKPKIPETKELRLERFEEGKLLKESAIFG
ncbi:MAG: FAD-binding oxidoreductase [Desulfurococcaceae archaeon TW002]